MPYRIEIDLHEWCGSFLPSHRGKKLREFARLSDQGHFK
ncbi:hypothetical protein ALQ08_102949 [Pseudomonas syringae pv. delphinii]|uniref:Uncharacterized protein n=3 Tax=Pseudomonas syringae group TaxID=136849 RepID=A0A3M4BIJ5_9PSED|nr:hypothetical protein ALQ94_101577 [Pseudomonas amygdali pv. morsprunorum]RMP14040.1 hypothetical protein ALQ28_102824 [Pseudomonas syringae pv. delphinii]RMP18214.1 hypothetical protein ALQ27_103014 [Pseudomonas syringae pv. delphinii]RMQ25261.1 hypothetical protein ALQ08_102949 [Pseudomonas syringae pv. delphinii]RMT59305.1 hypothetical protein ALP44_101863 [Pseudomonas syringae pv. theae]